MIRKMSVAVLALVVVAVVVGVAGASGVDSAPGDVSAAPPPDPYEKVSELVPLPEFIPGMGTLYVDPATLPVGPFLGYDKGGKLVQMTFMVPLSDLESHKNFTNLAEVANWFPVDHVDITYNPGHPGVAVPHYHITLWNVSPQEAEMLQ